MKETLSKGLRILGISISPTDTIVYPSSFMKILHALGVLFFLFFFICYSSMYLMTLFIIMDSVIPVTILAAAVSTFLTAYIFLGKVGRHLTVAVFLVASFFWGRNLWDEMMNFPQKPIVEFTLAAPYPEISIHPKRLRSGFYVICVEKSETTSDVSKLDFVIRYYSKNGNLLRERMKRTEDNVIYDLGKPDTKFLAYKGVKDFHVLGLFHSGTFGGKFDAIKVETHAPDGFSETLKFFLTPDMTP